MCESPVQEETNSHGALGVIKNIVASALCPSSLPPSTMTAGKNISPVSSQVVKDIDAQSDKYQDTYIQDASNDIYEEGSVDPVYQAKARLLSAAIQEIGMGKYQVRRNIFSIVLKLIIIGSGTSSSWLDLAGSRTSSSFASSYC